MTGGTGEKEGTVLSPSVNGSDTIRTLEESIDRVRRRIAAACRRSGRRPEEVRLVGVTKGLSVGTVEAAAAAGLRDLGENYVHDLEEKRAAAPGATWHFVGRMQRNKVPGVVHNARVIHTLEPGRAVGRLAGLIDEMPERPVCLIEVDYAGGRVGVAPDEAERFALRLREELGVTVHGVMTVAPLGGDPRPVFARLRELRDRIGGRVEEVRELSMGMSTDLEAAVEEGATMVRVGTAIFGSRPER